MWKYYSLSYIKNNKTSSTSVIAAALISSLFLSLLCSLFFNYWKYEVDNIISEEGDWQGRIISNLTESDFEKIQNYPNVEKIVRSSRNFSEQTTTVDIYFKNMRTIYKDMPLIAKQIGVEKEALSYHTMLLSEYLVQDPQDETPPLLLTFALIILIVMSISLILIIHNSFALTMNSRLHQFGIFSSVGATPRQIRICLIQEALALCIIPIGVGIMIGAGLSFGMVEITNVIASDMAERREAHFVYDPLVFIIAFVFSFLTVLFSAYIPAKKLSKVTPLEAIRHSNVLQLKRKKHSRILSLLFGIKGELAGNALKAQKKALRTSSLSLTLSFLAFTVMLCFLTLSDISTNHTYFERYQDVWDVMITVKDTKINDFDMTENLKRISGVQSSTVYQKALAECFISEDQLSDELHKVGGIKAVAGSSVTETDGGYCVQTPIIVLDDASFAEYCRQIGIVSQYNGTIVLNQIWDNINSNFRYKEYIPYVEETEKVISVKDKNNADGTSEIPILSYTKEVPILKEEYKNFALVQFMPLSLWKEYSGLQDTAEADLYIRILSEDRVNLDAANNLETSVRNLLEKKYEVQSENRIQEKASNNRLIAGYKLIIGAFCVILASIGIANVFSNTLNFIYQRKREFAQYMSIGMTPKELHKMLCIEAAVIASRPILITLPLTVVSVGFMITASYLDPMEFIVKMPIVPILIFILSIAGFVALAFSLGEKKVRNSNLADVLRNDALT